MTKKDLKDKVKDLLDRTSLEEKINTIIDNINIDNIKTTDIRTSKNILIAVLQHSTDRLQPLDSRKDYNEIMSLRKLITI